MQWCAAEPGPLQALSVGRSRICGASLHAAPYPGNVFDLLRIPLTPRSSASWCTGCNSRRPSAATSAHHWRRWFYWPCTDRGRFSARPSRLLLGIFGIDSARENRIRGDHRPSRCAASARTLRGRQIAVRFAEIIPLHSIETVGGFRLFVFGAAFGHRQRLCRSSLHSKNGNDCRSNKQGITRGRGSFTTVFTAVSMAVSSFAQAIKVVCKCVCKVVWKLCGSKRTATPRAVYPHNVPHVLIEIKCSRTRD